MVTTNRYVLTQCRLNHYHCHQYCPFWGRLGRYCVQMHYGAILVTSSFLRLLEQISLPWKPGQASVSKRRARGETWFFIFVQVKLISPRKVLHLDSFWKWEFLELENGLFVPQSKVQKCRFNTTPTQPFYILHEFIHAILKIQHWILTSRLNIPAYNLCLLTVKANQWSN